MGAEDARLLAEFVEEVAHAVPPPPDTHKLGTQVVHLGSIEPILKGGNGFGVAVVLGHTEGEPAEQRPNGVLEFHGLRTGPVPAFEEEVEDLA